jgi:cobalt-precorrin 5A hydrolase
VKLESEQWAYLSLTKNGLALCSKIKQHFGGNIITISKRANKDTDKSFDSFAEAVAYAFAKYDCLVCVMATGIVVRSIADLMKDKTSDPAVLVLDEKGEYCISLLSGHIGGANEKARMVSEAIGAKAVITTASDVSGKVAVDTLASELGCTIADMSAAKDITSMIVNGDRVMVCADEELKLPSCLIQDEMLNIGDYDGVIYISKKTNVSIVKPFVQLIPRYIVLGMGCRRDTKKQPILDLIEKQMSEIGVSLKAVASIVSVDIKADEVGLIEAAKALGVPFETVDRREIGKVEHMFEGSDFVMQTIGVSCVAQPCGYIASGRGKALLDIRRENGMTLSIWKKS